MDNVRQRQSIKDCLVYPSIANIQNPIYKARRYIDIYPLQSNAIYPYIYSYVLNAAVSLDALM